MIPRQKYFDNVSEFRLRNTRITDAGLTAINKTWNSDSPLRRLDATGSEITSRGLKRLKDTQNNLETVP